MFSTLVQSSSSSLAWATAPWSPVEESPAVLEAVAGTKPNARDPEDSQGWSSSLRLGHFTKISAFCVFKSPSAVVVNSVGGRP